MSAPTITAPATASGGVPVGGSGAAGYLAKWTAATTLGGSSSTAGATASPFVDATGQIGIFTATPAEALTVAAGSNDRAGLSVASAVSTLLLGSKLATESARQLQFDRATGIFAIKYGVTGGSFTTGLAMDGSGSVGVGNASPAATLHVGAGSAAGLVTTGPAVYVSSNGATSFVVRDATNSIESFLYAGSSVVLAGSATSHPYWIRTANTTRIAITATGEVGIGGTTSPTAALDLPASTTALASLRIQSGTAPTSPNNGDIWFDGTNIKMRIGGVTKTFTLV